MSQDLPKVGIHNKESFSERMRKSNRIRVRWFVVVAVRGRRLFVLTFFASR